jgi:hypothetical protein
VVVAASVALAAAASALQQEREERERKRLGREALDSEGAARKERAREEQEVKHATQEADGGTTARGA